MTWENGSKPIIELQHKKVTKHDGFVHIYNWIEGGGEKGGAMKCMTVAQFFCTCSPFPILWEVASRTDDRALEEKFLLLKGKVLQEW